MADSRRFVETGCHDCIIDVTGWDFGPKDEYTAVYVRLLSGHIPAERKALFGYNGRIRGAWMALRNRDDHLLEFYESDTVENFIRALQEARDKVWPEP